MSTIVTDTITGKSTATTVTIGSTPVVSASANSMTIRGEGSNQTSIQQGLAKNWCSTNHNETGTHTINDSFNTSSVADGGVGKTTNTYTTNFSSASYSTVLGTTNDNNQVGIQTGPTASSIVIVTYQHDGSAEDTTAQNSAGFGDLA